VDILIVLLLTLITVPLVSFTEGTPRIILGIIVLLVCPGYILVSALFPGRTSLKYIERAGLTIILSIAVVSLTGLILNYTPWGIRINPIIISISAIIIILSVITLQRRSRLPEDERFILPAKLYLPSWSAFSLPNRVLSIVLIVVVIGSFGTLAYVIERPKGDEAFTNFYILGHDGMMENYPDVIGLGDEADITLGIENHENQGVSYTVKVVFDGQELQEIGPITLADEGNWTGQINLKPSRAGENQKVEFFLYKDEGAEPYLNLRLWLDVN
jgi:uncharacterized membrane protein